MSNILGYKKSKTLLSEKIMLITAIIKLNFMSLFCTKNEKKHTNVIKINDEDNKKSINIRAEKALKTYGNSILRMAYSYLHNMNDAEDILQDTLIQYIKNVPDFKDSTHEKAWIMRVAINLSKNKIKYNKIRQASELDENLIQGESDDLVFVWDAVSKLPEKYREVIHLFYHEGYGTAQIANILQKNDATVRSLLSRARIKLKNILKEVYDFEE